MRLVSSPDLSLLEVESTTWRTQLMVQQGSEGDVYSVVVDTFEKLGYY